MKLLPSLERRDRTAVLVCLGLVLVMIVITAIFAPRQRDQSRVPSSYGVGTHGAKAAYLLLVRSGYKVERWEQPLANLTAPDAAGAGAAAVDEHTVLILAEPYLMDSTASRVAMRKFLAVGGHVLATGANGSYLLPDGESVANSAQIASTLCHAMPEGFDPLASSGEVDIDSPVVWSATDPSQRVQYRCGSGAVVVTYHSANGEIVWWASSTPLENASITRGGNLDLLLNSLGPPETTRIIWDESLHGDIRSLSSYTAGTPMRLLWVQAALIVVLLIFSFSRRSGPLRPLLEVPRTTPVEFVESLGSLYDRAGAANTAVVIAYERFRHELEKRIGFLPSETRLAAAQLAQAIETRLHYNHPELGADLAACEAAGYSELSRRRALRLVQALHDHSARLGLATSLTNRADLDSEQFKAKQA